LRRGLHATKEKSDNRKPNEQQPEKTSLEFEKPKETGERCIGQPTSHAIKGGGDRKEEGGGKSDRTRKNEG